MNKGHQSCLKTAAGSRPGSGGRLLGGRALPHPGSGQAGLLERRLRPAGSGPQGALTSESSLAGPCCRDNSGLCQQPRRTN